MTVVTAIAVTSAGREGPKGPGARAGHEVARGAMAMAECAACVRDAKGIERVGLSPRRRRAGKRLRGPWCACRMLSIRWFGTGQASWNNAGMRYGERSARNAEITDSQAAADFGAGEAADSEVLRKEHCFDSQG